MVQFLVVRQIESACVAVGLWEAHNLVERDLTRIVKFEVNLQGQEVTEFAIEKFLVELSASVRLNHQIKHRLDSASIPSLEGLGKGNLPFD